MGRSRKVVPLGKPVQVSRAVTDVPGVGKRSVSVARLPGDLSLEISEEPALETEGKVVPIKKPLE